MSGIALDRSEKDISRIVEAIIQLSQGRLNCVGEVTLTAGATETVVDKDTAGCQAAVNVSMDSRVFIGPVTGNGSGTLLNAWVSSVGQGTFTITHSNLPSTDRTLSWLAVG